VSAALPVELADSLKAETERSQLAVAAIIRLALRRYLDTPTGIGKSNL
jgi:hypothetical protein